MARTAPRRSPSLPRRPRGRPPAAEAADARDRILEAAARLLYAQGARATGVDALIAASGVAKMTFYRHFPTKQALVLEVFRRGTEGWLAALEATAGRAEIPAAARLLAVFDFLEAWFGEPGFRGCAAINLAAETGDRAAPECRLAADYKRRVGRLLEGIARDGGLPDPRRLAERLLLLIDGATVRAQLEDSARPARVAREIAAVLIIEAEAGG